MNPRRLIAMLLAIGLVAAFGSGCTLRYDFTECSSDQDCRDLEDPSTGKFLRCGADNTCVSEDIACRSDAHCGDGQRCTSGGRCVMATTDAGDASDADAGTDTTTDTSAPDADAGLSCDTNTECIDRFAKGYVCGPEGKCVDATNKTCPEIYYPNNQRDDVVILGSIIPESGPYKSVGTTLTNAIEMAVGEYFDAARSLPKRGTKVAWLQCDAKGESKATLQAARHLRDVGVPAIVGPLLSGNYLDVVDRVTKDAEITTIAPAATSPALSNLPVAGELSFRVIGNDRFQARALLDRLEKILSTDSDPSVTVFFKKDQYGQDFRDELQRLVLNAGWIDQSKITYHGTIDPASVNFDEIQIVTDLSNKVVAALNQRPGADVAVFIGTTEMITAASLYVDTAFQKGTAKTNPLNKRYVFSHGAAQDLPELPDALNGNEKLMPLAEGTSPDVIDSDNFPLFNMRYNRRFDGELTVSAAGVAYDAATLAILGMAAVDPGKPITGRRIGDVLKSGELQDSSGATIEFGNPNFQGTANNELADGNAVDVHGVSGNLDLNDDGDVRSDYVGLDAAISRDLNDNTVYDIIPTRLWKLKPEPMKTGTWGRIPPGARSAGVVESESPGVQIPSGSLKRTLNVQGCGTVEVAHVEIDVDHPTPKDLTVRLKSPGTSNAVLLRKERSAPPIKGAFPTTLDPRGDYSKFLGADGNGGWKLTISDKNAADTGAKLKSWSLVLYCGQ